MMIQMTYEIPIEEYDENQVYEAIDCGLFHYADLEGMDDTQFTYSIEVVEMTLEEVEEMLYVQQDIGLDDLAELVDVEVVE